MAESPNNLRHSVYYKKTNAGILVDRVLGPGMSAEEALPEPTMLPVPALRPDYQQPDEQ
jgi:hypothetical protein